MDHLVLLKQYNTLTADLAQRGEPEKIERKDAKLKIKEKTNIKRKKIKERKIKHIEKDKKFNTYLINFLLKSYKIEQKFLFLGFYKKSRNLQRANTI